MAERYCVGITMAVDWGDEEPQGFDRRVLLYFRPYWRAGAGALGCIAAAAALALVPALVLKSLIDYLSRSDPRFGHVAALIGVSMLAAVFVGAIGVLESYLTERISEGIIFDLRGQMFGSLLHQSVGFYTSAPAGEVMSRMTNDIEDVDDVVTETVFGVVSNAIIAASTSRARTMSCSSEAAFTPRCTSASFEPTIATGST
jgi:ATP-binding cassette subfamily B protein